MKAIITAFEFFFLLFLVHCSSSVRADESCGNLKKLDYEYFGTKTIYEDARKYLRRVDDDDLPKPFDDDSLAKEDKELREDDSCQPLVFYFIGRHTARFPDASDIEEYNKHLYELIEKIKTNKACSSIRNEFLTWRSKMEPKHDNLITDLGGREERNIARRFKSIYPEFFDTKTADVKIGVTKKWRTAQTGAQFLQQVDGLELEGCNNSSLPTNDVDRPDYNLDKVLEARCYKKMIETYEKPFLEFHKICDDIRGGEKAKEPLVERVKSPQLKKRIADRVAKRLGLDYRGDNAPVTVPVLESIYNMCKFENAIKDDSVWCKLFDKKDVQALEYMEDVSSYIKSAYGPRANPKQSCPLVGDLLEAFHEATKMSNSDKKRSYFYFSHADPIKKLLATFGMFRDDQNFSESKIREFEQDLKVPKKRHWRSSVIVPFSANLAFIMYRCPKSNGQTKYKILATVTEQPVKLGGCKDTDCNAVKFFDTYDSMRSCDMMKICSPSA